MPFNQLREELKLLSYPDNHCFDPETLEPQGKTIHRLEILKNNAPELFAGGQSLLEIGSNKGYFCIKLADKYEKVTGFDKAKEYIDFSIKLAAAHNIKNIDFWHGEFRDVPFQHKYDVVYIGNCHHYFFFDCAKSYAPPLLFLKKLAGICDKYLIIDGPFEISDPAVTKLSREGSWSSYVKSLYTFAQYEEYLKPQFELVRHCDNGLGRATAVFKRAKPDMEYIEGANLRRELIRKGILIECNPNRGPDSMFVYENRRYKFDMRMNPDGVFLVLNALGDFFPRFHQIIEYRGSRVGEVAEWVYGSILEDNPIILHHILHLNMVLGTVGLIELDFERVDFKSCNNRIYNVDIDLVRHISEIRYPGRGEKSWQDLIRDKAGNMGMKSEAIETLITNLKQKEIFNQIIKRGDYYVELSQANE
ncbi:MAG: class I SAM-dependent methyltransferase [Candidatus Omnitrophica bacterium]|nr:class I SAM-dependent methyltransferase [Candidatus Omnitrophota bacterium]MDD5592676.1 class I SAM-dependent methyltransferase [Candidatus Omnitrophota bacterium]